MAELDLIKNSSFEAKLDELVAVLMREKGMVSSVNGMIDAVVLDIPENTSDLNNDSGFITKAVTDLASYYLKSETYNKEEIDALIAPKLNIEIVTALPTDNISSTTIYLVPTKARTQNIYEEYIYVNGSWEFIGTTEVDLSNYYTKTEIDSKIATNSELGMVKVDGDTITVDADGTLHGAMKIDVDNALSNTSENPVQNKIVKDAIDTIQTTSKAKLSQAGWYRVAEYARGGVGEVNCALLSIRREYVDGYGETHRLEFRTNWNVSEFIPISHKCVTLYQCYKKIRHTVVRADDKSYLEVYFDGYSTCPTRFIITDGQGTKEKVWKAITPTLTSETVDGVTVTTTYDIPANASPVTDLDLIQFNGTETLNTSILAKANALANGVYNYRLGGGSYTGTDLPHSAYSYSIATIEKRSGSDLTVILSGVATDKTTDYPPVYNHYASGGWVGWKTFATTADLANYVAKTGDMIRSGLFRNNGAFQVCADGETSITSTFYNGKRNVQFQIGSTGAIGFYDNTNQKNIFQSSVDGTNTFNGTASGNLPLNGGGTVQTSHSIPLGLKNSAGNSCYERFIGSGGDLGGFGFSGENNPVWIDKTANTATPLLHTGNYSTYVTPANIGALSTTGTAAKATADANGNNIASTYATKASLGTAAAANTTTSVTSGGTGLPTAGAVYTAIQNAAGSGSVSASSVTAGTLGGQVLANATAVKTLGNKQVRNIYIGTSEMTAGTTALPAGDIYIQYTT